MEKDKNMSYYDDSPRYLTDYLNYIVTIKARSELTKKNYYTDLRLFLRFLKKKNGLVDKDVDFDYFAEEIDFTSI